jgi:hypothetical protein
MLSTAFSDTFVRREPTWNKDRFENDALVGLHGRLTFFSCASLADLFYYSHFGILAVRIQRWRLKQNESYLPTACCMCASRVRR